MASSTDQNPIGIIPILYLPLELQQLIYHSSLSWADNSKRSTLQTSGKTYLSLQLTCRLIQQETLELPFQLFPLSFPVDWGTNSYSMLHCCHLLQAWQLKMIRRAEIAILGCNFDAGEGRKVLQYLMNGNEGDFPSVGQSELSEIEITITARDVLTPAAEGVKGMAETLALDTSPVLSELINGVRSQKLKALRRVVVKANLGMDVGDQYDQDWVAQWKDSLVKKLNRDVHEDEATLVEQVIEVEVSFNRSLHPATMHYYTPKQFLADKNMGMMLAATMDILGAGAARLV
jgi:hypothetical protein